MTIDADFRAAVSLASARLLARAGFVRAAFDIALAEPDDTSTVADARSKKVDAFAALLVALFAQLQRGSIDVDEYLAKVGNAFDTAIGDVPADAQATIDQLRAKALERAKGYAEPAQLDREDEDAPSEDQKTNWGNIIAGTLWAASLAKVAYDLGQRVKWTCTDDERSCDDCLELDGKSWASVDDVPFFPGESDFGESLPDGTACGGNCRCECS